MQIHTWYICNGMCYDITSRYMIRQGDEKTPTMTGRKEQGSTLMATTGGLMLGKFPLALLVVHLLLT